MALSPLVLTAAVAAFLYAFIVALFLYKILDSPFSVGKRIGLSLLVIFFPVFGWGLFFLFTKGAAKEQPVTLTSAVNSSTPLDFSIEPQDEIPNLPEIADKTKVDVRYPLLAPYAYAHIHWDDPNTELVYDLEEPVLSNDEKKVLETLENGIRELINLSFIRVKDQQTVFAYLEKNVKVLLTELAIKIDRDVYMKLMYYIYRDFVGLNELEPLMNDYYIEDVECNGVGTPLYVVHRKYRNVRTSLLYPEISKLASFVEKLAQKCGKYISYAEPLLDGSLPDGSRVNATYTTDVSSRGPTFTVRKFTKTPWSPIQLMQKGTVSPEMLAYLWMLIEYEHSFMVVGGTGSGKTTVLNVLAFFIPPQARVVTIEDTRELQLEHENWLPSVSRSGVGLTNLVGERYGEVSLFDLLKESFRQRPDYVIVGEVRGKEAYVLFQGMASIKGDEKIFILKDNKPQQIQIKNLKEIQHCQAITYDIDKKETKIHPIKAILVHPERKLLYKITTKTGREVTLTPDHSVFTYKDNIICARMESLKIGDKIVIPSKIPCGYADLAYLDLLELLPHARVYAPKLIQQAVSNTGYYAASTICGVRSISDYYSNFTRSHPSSLKVEKYIQLMQKAHIDYKKEHIIIKFDKKSEGLPSKIPLTKELLRFLGYYISEGSLNKARKSNRISFYNKNIDIVRDMEHCIIAVTNKKPTKRHITHGFGEAEELSFSHKVIFELLKNYCGMKYEKKIPDFIFGLSKEKIGHFLTGLYNGDGSFGDNVFGYYTTSKEIADSLLKLLLTFGIVATLRKRNRIERNTTDYEILFYNGFDRLELLKYVQPLKQMPQKIKTRSRSIKLLGDLYIDQIRAIEPIVLDKMEPVFDIAVPGTRNFIGGFGGILLHNSGHPSFGTMHAESVETLVRRLKTPPISLSGSLIESLTAVCVMSPVKVKGKEVRRLIKIDEVIAVPEGEDAKPQTNVVFSWNPQNDTFLFNPSSILFQKAATQFGLSYEQILQEFRVRAKLLATIYQRRVHGYKDVQRVIQEYYKDPNATLRKFGL